jgi:hypothetical protein
MIKLTSRRAAIVLAGSALALAGGLVPAQAATSGWRIDTTLAVHGRVTLFSSVAASSPTDAWVTGLLGQTETKGNSPLQIVIRHWTGKAWRPVTLPRKVAATWADAGPLLPQVGAVSVGDVWVFGTLTGAYLRLSGGQWTVGRLPGAGSDVRGVLLDIAAVKVFSSTNVWAFGERDSVSASQEVFKPYAAHYNGHKWVRVAVPGSGTITAVAAASSSEMWAVEDEQSPLGSSISSGPNPPVVLHWTASTGWQDAAQQPPLRTGDQLTSAVAEANGDVWFGGSAKNKAKGTTPLAAEWNGTSWSVSDLPMRATSANWQLAGMTPDGTGGIWALAVASNRAMERIWHHGATWSPTRPAFGKRRCVLEALALVPRTRSVWGVGAVIGSKSTATNLTANGLIAVDGPVPH